MRAFSDIMNKSLNHFETQIYFSLLWMSELRWSDYKVYFHWGAVWTDVQIIEGKTQTVSLRPINMSSKCRFPPTWTIYIGLILVTHPHLLHTHSNMFAWLIPRANCLLYTGMSLVIPCKGVLATLCWVVSKMADHVFRSPVCSWNSCTAQLLLTGQAQPHTGSSECQLGWTIADTVGI